MGYGKPLSRSIKNRLELILGEEMDGNRSKLAKAIGFHRSTLRDILKRGRLQSPSLKKIKSFLEKYKDENLGDSQLEKKDSSKSIGKPDKAKFLRSVKKRVARLKLVLLLLEKELGEFRDGSPEEREVLRELLDNNDIGYVASLLTMICDEQAFRRWCALSNQNFNSFKKGS